QAIREITDDMLAPLRMHRLLMGDVGTGKTVVALFAMLLAVENDYQAAIMAPTELLAEQHLATLTRLLEPLALKPDLLIGRLAAAEKVAARERIAAGRSEEHTSELQSRVDLVCRLLLEKKKEKKHKSS